MEGQWAQSKIVKHYDLTSHVFALSQGKRKFLPTASLNLIGSFFGGRSADVSHPGSPAWGGW